MASRFPKARRLRKQKGLRLIGGRRRIIIRGGRRPRPLTIYSGSGRKRRRSSPMPIYSGSGQRGGSWKFWTKKFWTKEAAPWFEKTGKRIVNTAVTLPTLGVVDPPFKDV